MKEYHEVDEKGQRTGDVRVFEESEEVPENYKQGWGDRGFFDPIFDFVLGDWVEGLVEEEVAKRRKEIEEGLNRETPEERADRLENQLAETQSVLNNLMFGGMGL